MDAQKVARSMAGNLNKREIMKLSKAQKLVLIAACSVATASYVSAAPGGGGGGGMGASHGGGVGAGGPGYGVSNNPGMSRMSDQGRTSSEFGRTTATNAQNAADTDTHNANNKGKGKTKSKHLETTTHPGNSAFGHRQGNPATRTTGRQNNAFGKARSATAHATKSKPSHKVTTTHDND